MPRRVALVLLLSLLPLPPAFGAHAPAVGVEGPDPDGAYRLTYDIHREAAGVALLALEIERTDADGTLLAGRDLGPVDLPAGTSRRTFDLLPAEGPGRYVVALVVAGTRGGALTFDVEAAASSTTVTFQVTDEPTFLNLTNDSVNADGKVKSPGEPLVTRATASDANGLADLDALLWSVERSGSPILDGRLTPPDNATSWSLEHRFDASPFEAGNYTLRLRAIKAAATVASVTRTFVIREVAPTFVTGALANVTPDENRTHVSTFVLADKNGIPSGPLDARVYRGSARAEGAGFEASVGAATRLADADGTARIRYPLALRVPAGAAPGAYRVSLYHDGALVSSLPFDVRPLPTLASVNASQVGERLSLRAAGTGEGHLVGRLTDGAGRSTTVSAPFEAGTGSLLLDAPARGIPLTWELALHARSDGPAVVLRNGSWTAPSTGPALALEPLHVRPRLPAAWRLDAPWPLDGANASFTITRWDGEPETRVAATLIGDRVRVGAPPDLPAGRYTARAVIAWPNGTASDVVWTFDAGPWVELALGAPVVEGRTAHVPLRNVGGLAISRLIVETDPRAPVSVLHEGSVHAAAPGPRGAFAVDLAPGDDATLVVEIPESARRAGAHSVTIRVLARVEIR